MALTDLLDTGLSQTFSFLKRQYMQSAIKQSAIKCGVPVCVSVVVIHSVCGTLLQETK